MPHLWPLISRRRFRLSVIALALIFCALAIAMFSMEIKREIESQSTAPTDNGQWVLTQVDVEVLNLMVAVADGHTSGPNLQNIRNRFDILYSRMRTLRDSDILRPLHQVPEFTPSFVHIWQFLDGFVPAVDGTDAELIAKLPKMQAALPAVRDAARGISLTGVESFALEADAKRAEMARTLTKVAILTALLVLVLLSLVAILLRLDQMHRAHARENLMTLSRMQAIVMTALDGMIVADRFGRILEFNHAAERIFGHKRAAVLGEDLSEFIIPAARRAAHSKAMARYQTTGKSHIVGRGRIKLDGLRADDSIVPLEVSIARADSANGEIFIAFLRDLSSQIAAEQELLTARDDALAGEKAKADLLAVMSHEMRTPLNGMLGMIEVLDDTTLHPKQRDYLRVIEASGRLLLHHVNDVLDIARLDHGKMPFNPQVVDLVDLVQEIFENQQINALNHGNSLSMTPPEDGHSTVITDPIQLKQILMNLVGNALKFTRNGQISVTVTHHKAAGKTALCVIDTGIGIAPADLDRIFDDFVTLDVSYARPAGGTGLGLGIARRIAQSMGGTLVAHSELGVGSTFCLELPMDISATAAPHSTTPPNAASVVRAKPKLRLKILVVEDNAVNRLVVREMLRKQGHSVHEAHDGLEGVRIAALHVFDIIFMDISMPRMDGVQATHAIRGGDGLSKNTPIVALTAHALIEEAKVFRAAGMQEVLTKPISRQALDAVLSRPAKTLGSKIAKPQNTAQPMIIDAEILSDMVEDMGAARANRLIASFIDATEASLETLAAAEVSAVTLPDLTREVHKLCGSAALFGAVALVQLLRAQETHGKIGETAAFHATRAEVATLWATTRAAYEAAMVIQ